jgi:hypothetical protein
MLYVALDQADRWAQALRSAGLLQVEALGVGSATALVTAALRPADRLAGLDPPALQRTFAHLRRTSLEGGMAAALSWPAVRHTLAALRGRLPDQGPTMALLEGVAARYSRAEAVGAPPDAVFAAALDLRNSRQRHIHLAHAIQWAADAAAPLPAGVEAAVPLPGAGHFAHRVCGAWARWLLVAGPGPTEARAARALEAHQRIVEALLDNDELSEQSSSLAVWLQLSGGLGERGSFARAEGHLRRVEADADAEPRDLAYLRLARARGALSLGAVPPAVVAELRALRSCVAADAATGPYAGLGFLDDVIYRTLRLIGDEEALPHDARGGARGPSARVQAHLALAEGGLTVDQAIAAEDRCFQAAALGVAGPPADGEALRRDRLLRLYPY